MFEANYKVVFNPKFESGSDGEFEKECHSIEVAKAVKDAIADYTLFLHEKYLMPNHSNYAFILAEDENGDWEEYEDDEE